MRLRVALLILSILVIVPFIGGWSGPWYLKGDVNNDGIVNYQDLTIVKNAFNTSPPSDARADINHDGIVDIYDLAIVGQDYGKSTWWYQWRKALRYWFG